MSASKVSYTLREAAEATGVGVDTLRERVHDGTLRAKRLGKSGGGRILIDAASLAMWFRGLEDA